MIPGGSGGFRRDGDATSGAILKTARDNAKKDMDKKNAAFIKSFNQPASALIHAKQFGTIERGAKIRYTFTANIVDHTAFYNSTGVAYGFGDGFDGAGTFTADEVGPTNWYLTRTNTSHAKGEGPYYTNSGVVRFGSKQEVFYRDYVAWFNAKKKYKTASAAYDAWLKKYGKTDPAPKTSDGGGTTPTPSAPTTYAYGDTTLKYNLGAVNEMYFSPSAHPGGVSMAGGNQPVKRVGNAQELWTDQHYVSTTTGKGKKKKTTTTMVDNESKSAYKGMVQSLTKTAAQTTTGGSQEATPNKGLNAYRMGFQFHYNPSRISTTWAGSVNVDVGFVASGQDKFGPIGSALSTGSGVTVTIPLNRLSDMKYVNTPESGWGEMPWDQLYGFNLKEAPSGKESLAPTFEDLRKIRDLGTMYDVEFLLQTILGYRMKSAIRLNRHAMTSDLGYLGGQPVELHLGKNIRYYVSVNSIAVNHSIFTKDMIPTLSELTFTCSRIPDYISKK
jgi:hypothetical protein